MFTFKLSFWMSISWCDCSSFTWNKQTGAELQVRLELLDLTSIKIIWLQHQKESSTSDLSPDCQSGRIIALSLNRQK